jgi:helix-turn-helix protein
MVSEPLVCLPVAVAALDRKPRVRMTVLHWVLGLPIPSTEKFVLLVIALLADDMGKCYPSQAWISRMTGRTLKTVRTALAGLRTRQLVTWMPRRTNARGYTSNLYVVMVPAEVVRGSISGTGSRRGGQSLPGDRVTNGYQQQTDIGCSHKEDNTAIGSLVFANEIPESDREKILRAVPPNRAVAQQILDEVAARMKSGGVRSPLRYALGLIQRHKAGEFIPDKGLRVSGERLANEDSVEAVGTGANRAAEIAREIASLAASKVVQLRPANQKQKG